MDILESFKRQEEIKAKRNLQNCHFLARDIGQFTSLAIQGSDNMKVMELWDFFPELFMAEKEITEGEWQKQQTAVYKAQMIDYVYRHNHSRTGGEN